jgi:hypothetical protein
MEQPGQHEPSAHKNVFHPIVKLADGRRGRVYNRAAILQACLDITHVRWVPSTLCAHRSTTPNACIPCDCAQLREAASLIIADLVGYNHLSMSCLADVG